MEMNFTQAFLEKNALKRRSEAVTETSPTAEDQLWAYRKSAAVLHTFRPASLQPIGNVEKHADPRALLFDDISPTPGRYKEGVFSLELPIRKLALKKFSSKEEMLEAIQLNQDQPKTYLQELFESYLRTSKLPDAETLNYKELLQLCQLCSWLEGIFTELPDSAKLQALAKRKAVVATFEHLVANNFTGRETELSLLKRHVSNTPSTVVGKIKSALTSWLGASMPNPILSVYGPGGIGKSALEGKLLLDNAQADPSTQFPFAYLPFDQNNLRIESPLTILVEATQQFNSQFPQYQKDFDGFNEHVRDFRTKRSSTLDRRNASNSRSLKLKEIMRSNETLYEYFAALINGICFDKERTGDHPTKAVLVFDTFEEVEYRDREDLKVFWKMLEHLLERCASLRIIISGRTSIAKLGVKSNLLTELALEQLNEKDSCLLLQRLGVDEPTAKLVANQIGGNPLSLRLAANLIASDQKEADQDGIKDLRSRKWLLFKIDEELIQGQLYRRILEHIHNEDVRKLAHPGMVLRRISPDVILHVLAPLCHLDITSIAAAEKIFKELKREQAIVQSGNQGDLVYAPEIRRSMIKLLKQDKAEETKELHRKAIEYYSTKEGEAPRAEELYHRLALGEDSFETLDARWIDYIESSVVSNLEEYPDNYKVWLSTRINLEIPREILQKADLADWERNIFRKVKHAMLDADHKQVINFLNERKERTVASPLYALEGKAYLLGDQYDEAIVALNIAIEKISTDGNRGRLAELFFLRSQAELFKGLYVEADHSLGEAASVMVKAERPLPLIHIYCNRILIRREHKSLFTDNLQIQLNALHDACGRLILEKVRGNFILPLAGNLLGNEFPTMRDKLITTTPSEDWYKHALDMLTSENLQGLDDYREKWEVVDDYNITAFL